MSSHACKRVESLMKPLMYGHSSHPSATLAAPSVLKPGSPALPAPVLGPLLLAPLASFGLVRLPLSLQCFRAAGRRLVFLGAVSDPQRPNEVEHGVVGMVRLSRGVRFAVLTPLQDLHLVHELAALRGVELDNACLHVAGQHLLEGAALALFSGHAVQSVTRAELLGIAHTEAALIDDNLAGLGVWDVRLPKLLNLDSNAARGHVGVLCHVPQEDLRQVSPRRANSKGRRGHGAGSEVHGDCLLYTSDAADERSSVDL